MSDRREVGMALASLTEAYRLKDADVTPVMVKVYAKALAKVPVPLLEPMVQRCIETRRFFPKIAELLADAEACRKELYAKHQYVGCDSCRETPGFRNRPDMERTVERCPCFAEHLARVSALGVGSKPLALPAATEYEMTQVTE